MSPFYRKPMSDAEKKKRFERRYGHPPADDIYLTDDEEAYESDDDSLYGGQPYQPIAEDPSDSEAEQDHDDAALRDPNFADRDSDKDSEPMEDSETDPEEEDIEILDMEGHDAPVQDVKPELAAAVQVDSDDEAIEVIMIDDPVVIELSDSDESLGESSIAAEEKDEPFLFIHRYLRSGKEY